MKNLIVGVATFAMMIFIQPIDPNALTFEYKALRDPSVLDKNCIKSGYITVVSQYQNGWAPSPSMAQKVACIEYKK